MQSFIPYAALLLLSSCTTFAALPPMATLGGPTDVPKAGESQVAGAVGYGGVGLGNDDDDGYGLLARYRYGLSDRTNIGLDALGYRHGDEGGVTAKIELGHLFNDRFRLDFGTGVADDEHGKSVNADVAAVFGLNAPEPAGWNWYAALRLAGALGYDDDFNRDTQPGDPPRPRDSLLPMGSIGVSYLLARGMKLVIEGGYGRLFRESVDGSDDAFYVTSGILFGFP